MDCIQLDQKVIKCPENVAISQQQVCCIEDISHQKMHITILSLVVLVAVVVGQGSTLTIGNCPPPLVRNKYLTIYEKWCFEFVYRRTNTYDDASDDCKQFGGTLALIKDEGIQSFLYHQIQDFVENDDADYASLWIGLSDKDNEGNFVWEDGTTVSYNNWAPGQGPNHALAPFEDCGAIDTYRGQWSDEHCGPDVEDVFKEEERHYICQYEADEGGNLPTPAPPTA